MKELGEITNEAMSGATDAGSLLKSQFKGAYRSAIQASGLEVIREQRDRDYQKSIKTMVAAIVQPGGKLERVLSWLPKP